MDLQTLFYIVSIVFIFAWLLLLLIIIAAVILGMKGVRRISQKIEDKMEYNTAGVLISLIPVILMIVSELKKWSDRKKE